MPSAGSVSRRSKPCFPPRSSTSRNITSGRCSVRAFTACSIEPASRTSVTPISVSACFRLRRAGGSSSRMRTFILKKGIRQDQQDSQKRKPASRVFLTETIPAQPRFFGKKEFSLPLVLKRLGSFWGSLDGNIRSAFWNLPWIHWHTIKMRAEASNFLPKAEACPRF